MLLYYTTFSRYTTPSWTTDNTIRTRNTIRYCIFTDEGIIYVAKMDDKKDEDELVLI